MLEELSKNALLLMLKYVFFKIGLFRLGRIFFNGCSPCCLGAGGGSAEAILPGCSLLLGHETYHSQFGLSGL